MSVFERIADRTAREIWAEWSAFYKAHFRSEAAGPLSMADQLAFFEIAQPKLRALSAQAAAIPPAGPRKRKLHAFEAQSNGGLLCTACGIFRYRTRGGECRGRPDSHAAAKRIGQTFSGRRSRGDPAPLYRKGDDNGRPGADANVSRDDAGALDGANAGK